MKVFVALSFEKRFKKLVDKNPSLAPLIDKKLTILQNNPRHPSLRLHKLSGKLINQWSLAIKADLMILFQYVKGGILLVDIGSHNEVY